MTARIELPASVKRGEIVEIRIIIQHPMETGFRYDALGRRTPRNAIRSLVCRQGNKEIFRAAISTGIAANPYLRFFTRANASGQLEFDWVDDANVRGSATAELRVVD